MICLSWLLLGRPGGAAGLHSDLPTPGSGPTLVLQVGTRANPGWTPGARCRARGAPVAGPPFQACSSPGRGLCLQDRAVLSSPGPGGLGARRPVKLPQALRLSVSLGLSGPACQSQPGALRPGLVGVERVTALSGQPGVGAASIPASRHVLSSLLPAGRCCHALWLLFITRLAADRTALYPASSTQWKMPPCLFLEQVSRAPLLRDSPALVHVGMRRRSPHVDSVITKSSSQASPVLALPLLMTKRFL